MRSSLLLGFRALALLGLRALASFGELSLAVLALLGALSLAGCAKTTTERQGLPELRTVPRVDVKRYMGTWYEIASYPQRFQKGCTGTTATYSLLDDGRVRVENRCFKPNLDGELDTAKGLARVVDTQTNAKLEVSFFRPFWGDYWIVELGESYEYAAVGHPSRDYLWILSRTPEMPEPLYRELVQRLEAQGYDETRLRRTEQRPGPPANTPLAPATTAESSASPDSSATR